MEKSNTTKDFQAIFSNKWTLFLFYTDHHHFLKSKFFFSFTIPDAARIFFQFTFQLIFHWFFPYLNTDCQLLWSNSFHSKSFWKWTDLALFLLWQFNPLCFAKMSHFCQHTFQAKAVLFDQSNSCLAKKSSPCMIRE